MTTELKWTAYTADDYPQTTAEAHGMKAFVKAVAPTYGTSYGNREWRVIGRNGVVIASGYTLGSETARRLCELVMAVWE
jgi:hypothetical protein